MNWAKNGDSTKIYYLLFPFSFSSLRFSTWSLLLSSFIKLNFTFFFVLFPSSLPFHRILLSFILPYFTFSPFRFPSSPLFRPSTRYKRLGVARNKECPDPYIWAFRVWKSHWPECVRTLEGPRLWPARWEAPTDAPRGPQWMLCESCPPLGRCWSNHPDHLSIWSTSQNSSTLEQSTHRNEQTGRNPATLQVNVTFFFWILIILNEADVVCLCYYERIWDSNALNLWRSVVTVPLTSRLNNLSLRKQNILSFVYFSE